MDVREGESRWNKSGRDSPSKGSGYMQHKQHVAHIMPTQIRLTLLLGNKRIYCAVRLDCTHVRAGIKGHCQNPQTLSVGMYLLPKKHNLFVLHWRLQREITGACVQ